jgi:23S rRNA G2445 N2-methylase RlmL
MEAIAITHPGIEDVAAKEAKALIGAESGIKESVVHFKINHPKELCLLCYKAQSIIKVVLLLSEFKASADLEKTFNSLKPEIEKAGFLKWMKNKHNFKVECKRTGSHNFSSVDLSAKATSAISDKTKIKADFKNPEIIIFLYIYNDAGYFGIDFAGIDLSKRDYKVFAHPASLKGTIAYSLLRVAGYKKNEALLDAFTKSGVIPIEAALYATGSSVNYYRKDLLAFNRLIKFDFKKIDKKTKVKTKIFGVDSQIKNLKAAEKNAKIAGIKKLVTFSRVDVEWLDTKFKKGQIDKIVTSPPSVSKRACEKEIEKLYKEFFYQAEYILSKKGRIVTINRSPELLKQAAAHYFRVLDERTVWSGKEALQVLVFGKK